MFKKIFIFICILLASTINVKALSISDFENDELFHVYSLTYDGYEEIGSFKTYKEALTSFNKNKDNYDNLSIFSNGKFYKAEYAIVTFESTPSCDYNVEFVNDIDNKGNYLNGCYGFDGAYLDTNQKGDRVKFKISGVNGWAKMDDVTIYPLQLIPNRLTKYTVINNELFHQIKQNFNNDYYGSLINLGPAPSYLQEGLEYYSYDGNYFYNDDSLWMMLDDYKNNNYNQSINKDDPYFNYYQYVSHRTLSNYDEDIVNDYIKNVLHIDSDIKSYLDLDKNSTDDTLTNSQFYEQAYSFFQYQYQFGSNALMMLALSWNETALGRSSLAFTRNNLFGHSAFDSDVEKNASRYINLSSSVYSHARYYISNSYCNPKKFQYHGCYFGDKASGMNVSYASDPYWGEKAASNYYRLDSFFGLKDLNKYTIGIKTKSGSINVYSEPSSNSNVLYKTDDSKNISFLILDSIDENWYKVQSDASLGDIHYYDFSTSIGYIKKGDIQVVIDGKGDDSKFVKVTFDAGEGLFRDGSNVISYYLESYKKPSIEYPVLDNHLFIGWDKEVIASEEEQYYTAVYKEVKSISMDNIPKTDFETRDRIDIKNGSILVEFVDGSEEKVLLSTGMVSGFDLNQEGNQEVIVTYGGKTTSYPITVSQELSDIRIEIKDEIVAIIEEYNGKETLSESEKERVLNLKLRIDEYMLPYLNQQQLKEIDKIVRLAIGDQIHYVVAENKFDSSISGLSLSVKIDDSLEKGFIKDTYKMVIKDTISNEAKEKMEEVALAYGYTVFKEFKVEAEKNFGTFDLHGPVVIGLIKPQDSNLNQLFTVLRYDDGEVVETYTRQSENYIQFMTTDFGEFLVVAKNTTNIYDIEDSYENINVANSDIDQYSILSMIFMGGSTLVILIIVFVLYKKRKR